MLQALRYQRIVRSSKNYQSLSVSYFWLDELQLWISFETFVGISSLIQKCYKIEKSQLKKTASSPKKNLQFVPLINSHKPKLVNIFINLKNPFYQIPNGILIYHYYLDRQEYLGFFKKLWKKGKLREKRPEEVEMWQLCFRIVVLW
jgi:hypothetical protein